MSRQNQRAWHMLDIVMVTEAAVTGFSHCRRCHSISTLSTRPGSSRKLPKPRPLQEAFPSIAPAEGGGVGGLRETSFQPLWAFGLVKDERLPRPPVPGSVPRLEESSFTAHFYKTGSHL